MYNYALLEVLRQHIVHSTSDKSRTQRDDRSLLVLSRFVSRILAEILQIVLQCRAPSCRYATLVSSNMSASLPLEA